MCAYIRLRVSLYIHVECTSSLLCMKQNLKIKNDVVALMQVSCCNIASVANESNCERISFNRMGIKDRGADPSINRTRMVGQYCAECYKCMQFFSSVHTL